MSEGLMENGELRVENDLRGWREVRLGDVSEYVNRGVSPKYTESDGIIVINQKCIRNGQVNLLLARLHDKNKKFTPVKLLKRQDILINSTGVGTAGRVGIFNNKQDAIVDSHVSILRLNQDIVYPYFIFYNLRGREKELEETAEGSTGQIELKRDGIKGLDISLPPLPEQKAIAAVLSSLDDKIDLLHRQNKTLEQMAETLYKSWILEKEFNSSIKDLIDLQNGFAFKSKDFKDTGSHRVLKIKNISGDIVDIQATDYVSAKIVSSLDERLKIKTGDILFAMTGAKIGKMGIIPQTEYLLWLNQRVGLFKEKYKGSRFLAYLHLKSDYGIDYIENTATGSAQPNISGISLENCEFPKFSEQLTRGYSEQLDLLFGKVIFNLGQIHTLEKLRDTLLSKLMSGEVRVEYTKEASQ